MLYSRSYSQHWASWAEVQKKKKKKKEIAVINSSIHMAVSGDGRSTSIYMAHLLTYLLERRFLLPFHSQVTWLIWPILENSEVTVIKNNIVKIAGLTDCS